MEAAAAHFSIAAVPSDQLDPVYQCTDVDMLRLTLLQTGQAAGGGAAAGQGTAAAAAAEAGGAAGGSGAAAAAACSGAVEDGGGKAAAAGGWREARAALDTSAPGPQLPAGLASVPTSS